MRSRAASRIFYLVPDYAEPSWGVGLLYRHVHLLRGAGFDARVLHQRAPFRLPWLDGDAPVEYLDRLAGAGVADDVIVVPEILAAEAPRTLWRCRWGVFVQGSFLILAGHDRAFRYPDLGFEFALAVLPHAAEVVARHFGLPARVVPPCVAPYFFRDEEEIRTRPRRRLVLLAAKKEYRRAGFPDYDIFTKLVRRTIEEQGQGWRVQELSGLDHRQVAELMAEAALLVNLNSHEAFNTTVPEAMAAGCIPICYEAVGGRDFLAPGAGAFVFPNHHVYALVEQTCESMAAFDRGSPELLAMRLRARASVARFAEEETGRALVAAFTELLGEAAERRA